MSRQTSFSNAVLGIKHISYLDINVADVPCSFLSPLSESGTEELPGIGHLPFLFRIRKLLRFTALKDIQLSDFLRKPRIPCFWALVFDTADLHAGEAGKPQTWRFCQLPEIWSFSISSKHDD